MKIDPVCGPVRSALIFLLLALLPGCSATEQYDNPFLRPEGARPFVVGHGGSKHLFPENTMISFDGVDSMGLNIQEMDVLLTKDGELITFHDQTIDRMTDGTGRVDEFTFDELGKFNFAYNFKGPDENYPFRNVHVGPARLEDVIAKYGHRYLFFIELKADAGTSLAAADSLVSILRRYDMEERTAVSCFRHDMLEHFREISGGRVLTGMSAKTAKRFVVLSKLGLPMFRKGNDALLQIPLERDGFKLAKRHIVRKAHRKGVAVYYWTVNSEEDMRKVIELGADGIITDRPDILKRVLDEAGY